MEIQIQTKITKIKIDNANVVEEEKHWELS